jgi:hypothetical protein
MARSIVRFPFVWHRYMFLAHMVLTRLGLWPPRAQPAAAPETTPIQRRLD